MALIAAEANRSGDERVTLSAILFLLFYVSQVVAWRSLPLTPIAAEMSGGPPLEDDRRLRGVRKDTPYASLEDYLQTSYRLLRAECFSPVLKVP